MQTDPFDQYNKPSSYFRKGQGEAESLRRIQKRLDGVISASKTRKPGHFVRILTIVAAAAVIFIIVLFNPFVDGQQKQLAGAYFSPYPNYSTPQVRGEAATIDALRKEALQAYDNDHYEGAIEYFTEMADDLTTTDRFYLAQAFAAEDKWKAALDILVTLDDITAEYRDAVRWHTALCRVALGETELARAILIPLMTTRTEFASEARRLLDELE